MDEEKGFLQYQIVNIRRALDILQKTRSELAEAMLPDSPLNPNEYGHLDRIIREYIVIKVAALYHGKKSSFCLQNMKDAKIDAILLNYKAMLKIIKKNRDRAFGHHQKKFIMTGSILSTNELFGLPLVEFLNEIEAQIKQ